MEGTLVVSSFTVEGGCILWLHLLIDEADELYNEFNYSNIIRIMVIIIIVL